MYLDPKLLEYATDRQREVLEAINRYGTAPAAAKELNITVRNVRSVISRLRRNAAIRGYAPDHNLDHELPPGQTLKGVSTLINRDGDIVAQWIKSKTDNEQLEEITREIISSLLDDIKGKSKKIAKPKRVDTDLLSAYCIGDAHLGMYAWGDEAGEDFDLDIAERDLCSAIDRMVDVAPKSKECLIAQLGDFFHMDDNLNATPANRNPLDVDTRYIKVVKTGVKILKYIIDCALRKHEVVRVRNIAGNHDPHSSVALTLALSAYYDNNDRVIIENSPAPFWWMEFGNCLIGLAHGHAPKPDKLPGVLAVEAREAWHKEFKYIWHGHIHTKQLFEEMHCKVESFRTLAARDAWHATEGYSSGREMQCVVLHRDYGEIERYTAGIHQVRST